MAYYAVEQRVVEQLIADNSATQLHSLGEIIRAVDPTREAGEFIYLKGVISTVVGSWVLYNPDDYSTSLLVADDIGHVAVAMAATVADEFGWYQISGKASGKAKTGFADDADVYGTSTGGSVDDAVVAGDRVQHAKGASAVSDGLADFEIHRPFVNNALAD